MDQAFLEQGERYPVLGPNYFAARDAAEKLMAKFEAEHFKPLADKFAEQFRERLWDDFRDSLLSDTESNLQSTMWHQVEETVKAILSGEEWAMRKYALGERYDCEKIRATVAKHIPAELQVERMKDLEKEVAALRERIESLQRFR